MTGNDLYLNGLNVFLNDFNYCVDMLRLSCQITADLFELKIGSRVLIYKDNLTHWTTGRIAEFYHNYTYTDDKCSFWFGFISNKEKSGKGKSLSNPNTTFNFTVEFNPNKVKDNSFLLHILKISSDWVVKSCDFAIDINTNILNICGLDKLTKKCLITYDMGGSDRTYYIGKGNNRLKIYNKTIESGLDYDLTRVETTCSLDDLSLRDVKFFRFNGCLPELYINEFQISLDDLNTDKTVIALVYAVTNGYPMHNLSRRYREHVKEFLGKKNPVVFDSKCLEKCFCNYIYYYFPFLLN